MSRTESPRKHLAVHARQLALEPDLQILRRHRRSLLRRLEQAHRSALADHVHRNAPMGPPVLISESWYKTRKGSYRAISFPLDVGFTHRTHGPTRTRV